MDSTTDQIKREIEEARERISETTSQIGERIRSTFDWRQQVAEHPWAALGVATAAGFLVGAATSRAFRGGRTAEAMADRYAERYAGDRTSSDLAAQAEATSARHGAAFAGVGPGGEGREAGSEWRTGPVEERRWKARAGETFGRAGERLGRAGAATGGLIASLGAALAPQLQEVGRDLADQLKDLSNQLIAQGREYLQQRVEEWKAGRGGDRGTRHGSTGSRPPAAAPSGWPAPGGSSLSSESASAWPTGSRAGGGAEAGSAPAGASQANVGYGAGEPHEGRTPQSREREPGGR